MPPCGCGLAESLCEKAFGTLEHSGSQALPGNRLLRGSASRPARFGGSEVREAEPPEQGVPRQSLGTRGFYGAFQKPFRTGSQGVWHEIEPIALSSLNIRVAGILDFSEPSCNKGGIR